VLHISGLMCYVRLANFLAAQKLDQAFMFSAAQRAGQSYVVHQASDVTAPGKPARLYKGRPVLFSSGGGVFFADALLVFESRCQKSRSAPAKFRLF
jgi:hypothetical protein